MNRRPARRATGVLVVAVLAACGRERGAVNIGVVFPPANTPLAFLAADQINAAGGIHGRPVVIVVDTIADSAEPADLEIRRARSIVGRARVVGVVGHGGSRGSLAAAPVYNEAHVVELVPTGTSRLLAQAGPWTLALPPNDSVEGAFMARFVTERLRARTVAIFYINDEYGIGLRDGLLAALGPSGVRILSDTRYDLQSDLAVLVDAAVAAGAPDVFIVAGRAGQTATIARRLRDLRLPTRIVSGDGSHQVPELARASGPAAEGIYVVAFWLPGMTGDTVGQRFSRDVARRLSREPGSADVMIYDGVRLLATAVAEVGDDPDRVLQYLMELGRSRPRYRGVVGEIGFGAGAGPARFTMGVVRAGAIVPVEPPSR
jgi:branched-chain amino acid transport system substrate-binding protein